MPRQHVNPVAHAVKAVTRLLEDYRNEMQFWEGGGRDVAEKLYRDASMALDELSQARVVTGFMDPDQAGLSYGYTSADFWVERRTPSHARAVILLLPSPPQHD